MKKIDKIRILVALILIALGISMLITGNSNEKIISIFVFLLALYPLSKIGFEDRFKI
jgi:cadmium resistance protein CadD (predicted permease)